MYHAYVSTCVAVKENASTPVHTFPLILFAALRTLDWQENISLYGIKMKSFVRIRLWVIFFVESQCQT